ncbi:amino acid ABC transporter permease [Amantichitinum ursilacus]|uniref:Glutamate/aspartate import permease protein GltK n=1 Tax=Amantichitinum ursilacus TaxID=857265 RepID=A0A0N0XH94_9NEIS|nr:ABC transporter permease subunit [Amantichitinum ursilacus]KPC50870.1 Glutamate/aspartate transport system permease protein GltK [Amantichitinum ursilacus]
MTLTDLSQALPGLWEGMKVTLELLVMAVVGGIVVGTLLALMRLSGNKFMSAVAGFYVTYFRSIPLLMVISWFYFAVPLVIGMVTGTNRPIGAFVSCLVAFTAFEAAYYAEIIRAGIQSISRGQVNAAYALGMTYPQAMRLVILPQAFRKMTPLLLQQSIILFQDTSLVYAVGLLDFFNTSYSKGNITGEIGQYIMLAGAVYFVISFGASRMVKRLQKRFTV